LTDARCGGIDVMKFHFAVVGKTEASTHRQLAWFFAFVRGNWDVEGALKVWQCSLWTFRNALEMCA